MPDNDLLHERIVRIEDKLIITNETLQEHSARLLQIAETQKKNEDNIQLTADNTSEIVRIFSEMKIIFKWGVAAKKFIIWIASIAAALIYFWDHILDWLKS